MMVITSVLELKAIHEATKKIEESKLDKVDLIHLDMQERVLKELEDWDRDDCMIDGYDNSAFSPYKHLISDSEREKIKAKISVCTECGDPYSKEKMVFDEAYFCQSCHNNKDQKDIAENQEVISQPMSIESEKGFAYEFGVLLFNLLSDHKDSLKITNQYDVVGNLTSLFNSFKNVDMDSVQNGFVSECQNYGITEAEAQLMYGKVFEVLKEHDMSCPLCEKGQSMGTFSDGHKEPCDDCLLEQDKQANPELYQNKD